MRHLSFLLLLLIGCTTPQVPDLGKSPSGFVAFEYTALSNLNMGPRDTANYLFSETCDNDFFSSITHVGSDGIVASKGDNVVYRYYQTYRDIPVWSTKLEILWDSRLQVPTKASLLVADPAKFLKLDTVNIIQPDEALLRIENFFLAADEAENYEIVEPAPVYFYRPTTNSWHYGWGSTVISHHSGYDPRAAKLVLVTLVYSIIIDATTGEQLLLEFNMRN
jgi:hypothetical protein